MLCTAFVAVMYVNVYTDIYQKNVESIPTENQIFKGYIKEINNPENTGYIVALLDENCREIYNISVYYSPYFDIGYYEVVPADGGRAINTYLRIIQKI